MAASPAQMPLHAHPHASSNRGGVISFTRALSNVWLSRKLNRAPRTLPILVLMVTDKCNLKCKMCGACDYSPGDHNMLSTVEWLAVLDSAARIGTRIVSITGGEALLRRDLFDIIARARSHGMAVHLNTNGIPLNERNVEKLAASGVETVSISIESPDQEIHDAIRGEGAFADTLLGLRRLRSNAPNIRIGLNCVVNKHNLDGLREMVPFAKAEGVDQIKFAPIHSNLQHKDKPIDEYVDMVFAHEDMPALDAEVDAIQREMRRSNLRGNSSRFFNGFTQLYQQPASNFYCYAGYAITVIDAQGNVAACFDKPGALNVRTRPLDEIWRSDDFQRHRQLVRNCKTACWDTTNAELSLRLSPLEFLKSPVTMLRDAWFYLRSR